VFIRFVKTYYLPGTSDVLNKIGDSGNIRSDIARALIDRGYAVQDFQAMRRHQLKKMTKAQLSAHGRLMREAQRRREG
jgi:hypothetical protein